MSSVDELMKSTIEQKLFLKNKKNKNYSASFYILEKTAREMLDHVINRKQKSADIAEKAAAALHAAEAQASPVTVAEAAIVLTQTMWVVG